MDLEAKSNFCAITKTNLFEDADSKKGFVCGLDIYCGKNATFVQRVHQLGTLHVHKQQKLLLGY